MTVVVWPLAVVTALAMLTDWWSVRTERHRLESVAKPAVMLALIAIACFGDVDPGSVRPWIVGALVLGLLGDVFLLPQVDQFLGGLGAFLFGHLAYLVAFATIWSPNWLLAIGGIGIVLLLRLAGADIIRSLSGSSMRWPVIAYIGVTVAIVVLGTATGRLFVALGALAFASSDGLLGTDRFVRPAPDRRVVVHISYHVGQAAILAGFITG